MLQASLAKCGGLPADQLIPTRRGTALLKILAACLKATQPDMERIALVYSELLIFT